MFGRRFRIALLVLLVCNITVWCSAAKVYAVVEMDPGAQADGGGGGGGAGGAGGVVKQDQIYIPVYVFVTSIIGTVMSTWYIARMWHASEKKAAVDRALMRKRMDDMERELHGKHGGGGGVGGGGGGDVGSGWDGGGSDGN